MKKFVYFILLITAASYVYSQAVDTDGDGMPDYWEDKYSLNKSDHTDAYKDLENDDVTNLEEYIYGCDPRYPDTDRDTHNDSKEIFYGTNCSNSQLFPNSSWIKIELVNPVFGVSKIGTFNFTIRTDKRASLCKYSTNSGYLFDELESPQSWFTTGDGYTHNYPNYVLNVPYDNYPINVYVRCRDASTGYINDEFPVKIPLTVDRTRPVILEAYADPPKVIERLYVDLIAVTDDKTVCRIDLPGVLNQSPEQFFSYFYEADITDFKTEHEVTLTRYTSPSLQDETSYEMYVFCMNRAEWFIEDLAVINFTVNLSTLNRITETYPDGPISTQDTIIRVVTNKNSDCMFGEGYFNQFPQTATTVHYIEEQDMQERAYSIPIVCVFSDAGFVYSSVNFTVDFTPPEDVEVAVLTETCDNKELNADFSATDNLGKVYFWYRILNQNNTAINDYTRTNYTSANVSINLTRGQTYYWQVIAMDRAGNNATPYKTTGTKILTTAECTPNQPPSINASGTLTESEISLSLKCSDLEGYCDSTEYFVTEIYTDCDECTNCTYQKYLLSKAISIKKDSKICYRLTDDANTTSVGDLTIKFQNCTISDTCCVGREGVICINECTIIDDLDCDPQNVDSDKDGIPDVTEDECGMDPNDADDVDEDEDGDGLSNYEECITYGTDISRKDTDGDGYDDKNELDNAGDPRDKTKYPPQGDLDGDKITEQQEKNCGLDRTKDDAELDEDGDGLTNYEECVTYSRYGISPHDEDSDGDGVGDKVELDKGTDPSDPDDFPKSYVLNILMFALGIGMIGGGAAMFSKESKNRPMRLPKAELKKPMVDFNQAQREMVQEVPRQPSPMIRPKQNLDLELLRKRELLRMKKMDSIFDEFAEEKDLKKRESPVYKKLEKIKKKEKLKTFDRLEDISEEDPFEELEKIEKKVKK